MSRRVTARLAMIASLLAATDALAQPQPARCASPGDAACSDEALPDIPGFYGIRHFELWAHVFLQGDWYDVPHPNSGAGLDFVLLMSDDRRFRFGPYTNFGVGTWGDVHHGQFTVETGWKQRWSFAMNDVFDEYIVAKAGIAMGTKDGSHAAFRPGIGLGMRVFRGLQIDATWDTLVGLDAPFSDVETDDVRFGGSLEVGIDLCVFVGCPPEERRAAPVEKTCGFYTRAAEVCTEAARSSQHVALCAAVRTAMNAEAHPVDAGRDATAAFLAALESRAPAGMREALCSLRSEHDGLVKARECSVRNARALAREKKDIAAPIAYEPYAAELRRAFGCDTDPPACNFACEDGAPPAGPR